jgi:hypothetical protein
VDDKVSAGTVSGCVIVELPGGGGGAAGDGWFDIVCEELIVLPTVCVCNTDIPASSISPSPSPSSSRTAVVVVDSKVVGSYPSFAINADLINWIRSDCADLIEHDEWLRE